VKFVLKSCVSVNFTFYVRLVTSSALQSRKWQLIGMSQKSWTSMFLQLADDSEYIDTYDVQRPPARRNSDGFFSVTEQQRNGGQSRCRDTARRPLRTTERRQDTGHTGRSSTTWVVRRSVRHPSDQQRSCLLCLLQNNVLVFIFIIHSESRITSSMM